MDVKFMIQALKEAQKAYDKNEVPIGCVIVLNGKIILVRDRNNNIVPYINPNKIKKINSLEDINGQIEELRTKRVKYMAEMIELWSKKKVLSYQYNEIMDTIAILEEIDKQSSIEQLGGRSYVKKY